MSDPAQQTSGQAAPPRPHVQKEVLQRCAMDHTSFPHIMDMVLSYADRGVRIAFRGTSRLYRSKIVVDTHLVLTHAKDSQGRESGPHLVEYHPSTPLPAYFQPTLNHEVDEKKYYALRRVAPNVLDIRDSCANVCFHLPKHQYKDSDTTIAEPCNPQVIRLIPLPTQQQENYPSCFLMKPLTPETLVVLTSLCAEMGWLKLCMGFVQKLVINVDMDHHVYWPEFDCGEWSFDWDFLMKTVVIIFRPTATGQVSDSDLKEYLGPVVALLGSALGAVYNYVDMTGPNVVFVGLESLTSNLGGAAKRIKTEIIADTVRRSPYPDLLNEQDIARYADESVHIKTQEEYMTSLTAKEWELETVM